MLMRRRSNTNRAGNRLMLIASSEQATHEPLILTHWPRKLTVNRNQSGVLSNRSPSICSLSSFLKVDGSRTSAIPLSRAIIMKSLQKNQIWSKMHKHFIFLFLAYIVLLAELNKYYSVVQQILINIFAYSLRKSAQINYISLCFSILFNY